MSIDSPMLGSLYSCVKNHLSGLDHTLPTNTVYSPLDLGHPVSGTIALFTHFSLFFPLFCSLTHIPLSQPVMSLFILIFHPLPCACTCDIQPARWVSFFFLISWSCDWSPDRHVLATWLCSYWSDCSQPIGTFVGFHVCPLLETKHGPCAVTHGVDRSLFFAFFTPFSHKNSQVL